MCLCTDRFVIVRCNAGIEMGTNTTTPLPFLVEHLVKCEMAVGFIDGKTEIYEKIKKKNSSKFFIFPPGLPNVFVTGVPTTWPSRTNEGV